MRALTLALTVLMLIPAAASAADRTKPTTPGSLRVTATTTTSVSLAWNASTDNSGSVTYRVREAAGTTRTTTATSFTWPGLSPNRTYRFTVSASDPSGNRSPESNQVSATTPASVPPAAPANLRLTGAGVNTLSFAWDPVAGATRYELSSPVAGWFSTPASAYTVHWLQPDTGYTFTVRAFNAAGTASAPSAPVTVRTLRDTTAPSVPVVSGFAYSPSEVQLNWPASSDDSNYVSYNVDLDGRFWPHMLPGDNQTMTVRNLRDGTTYDFSVKAYDGSGNFSEAGRITITTPESPDTTPPPAPANLTQGWLTPHTVPLSWSGSGDVFAYEVWMDGAFLDEVAGDWRYAGMLIPAYEARHLAPGSTHTFAVRSRDEGGNLSAPSAPITVTLPASSDTTPPDAPTGLLGSTAPGCAFADFMWNGPGDVEVFEDGHFIGAWSGEVIMTSFGRRTYTVRAVDAAGNLSEDSNPVVLDHGMRC
jgi:chitodextrinase